MSTQKYKCIAQPKNRGMNFTIGKEYEFTFDNYPNTFDDLKELCSFSTTSFNKYFQKVEPTKMTEKYKCLASQYGLGLTSGLLYDIDVKTRSFINDRGIGTSITEKTLQSCFEKVEPTTIQPMKYKVTITSTDLTGHEDEQQHPSYSLRRLIEDLPTLEDEGFTKLTIEPMPEKQKVTVWFYVVNRGSGLQSISSTDKHDITTWHNSQKDRVVSEIKSMEVEI